MLNLKNYQYVTFALPFYLASPKMEGHRGLSDIPGLRVSVLEEVPRVRQNRT